MFQGAPDMAMVDLRRRVWYKREGRGGQRSFHRCSFQCIVHHNGLLLYCDNTSRHPQPPAALPTPEATLSQSNCYHGSACAHYWYMIRARGSRV